MLETRLWSLASCKHAVMMIQMRMMLAATSHLRHVLRKLDELEQIVGVETSTAIAHRGEQPQVAIELFNAVLLLIRRLLLYIRLGRRRVDGVRWANKNTRGRQPRAMRLSASSAPVLAHMAREQKRGAEALRTASA